MPSPSFALVKGINKKRRSKLYVLKNMARYKITSKLYISYLFYLSKMKINKRVLMQDIPKNE